MKASDRTILVGVALLALVAVFWFLVLSPKRQEASDLESQVADLQAEVTQAEQSAATGQQAKKEFDSNYRHLITLGKAVPKDADTPSLLTQLETLSTQAGVDFQSITLDASASGSAAAPAPAPTTSDGSSADSAEAGATVTATATEAAASLLPIGATIGPAGLPVMPYTMKFQGGFFDIADFFGEIDGMVESNGKKTSVDGRLLTINGFTMAAGPNGLPQLTAEVQTTSYVTPADQGVTAGATAGGPGSLAVGPGTATPSDPSADSAVSSAAVVAN